MENQKSIQLMGQSLILLGQILQEKAQKGKIAADSRIGFLNSISNTMRITSSKNEHSLLKPADGKKDALLTGKLLDGLSQIFLNYAENQAFSQNLQTDLKNKARELAQFLEEGQK